MRTVRVTKIYIIFRIRLGFFNLIIAYYHFYYELNIEF